MFFLQNILMNSSRHRFSFSCLFSICFFLSSISISWGLVTSLRLSLQSLLIIAEAASRRCSVKKDVLRNFSKFKGKHLYQSHFLNKVAGLKKRLCHRCFPVNFGKFPRPPLLQITARRVLLSLVTWDYPDYKVRVKAFALL